MMTAKIEDRKDYGNSEIAAVVITAMIAMTIP